MSEKAQLLPPRHTKQCDICMLIDVENEKMEFHPYKKQWDYISRLDKVHYVCNECVDGLKDIRKKCHQKVDNPHHTVFQDYIPWFVKQIPGLQEAFAKNIKDASVTTPEATVTAGTAHG